MTAAPPEVPNLLMRDAVRGVHELICEVVGLVRAAFSLSYLLHYEDVEEPDIRSGRRRALGTAEGQDTC